MVWIAELEAELRRSLSIKPSLDKDLNVLNRMRWLLDEVYSILSR